MPKPRNLVASQGFSLAEMMVALVFTMLLMAGMTTVFKTSIANFYTSGEALSSARRNRMSMDMMADDLNAAGMYLQSLAMPPQELVSTNPPFYILPNMKIKATDGIADADPEAGDPSLTDELYFYMDEPLPFEGRVSIPPSMNAVKIPDETKASTADRTIAVDCGSKTYAEMVKSMVVSDLANGDGTKTTGMGFISKQTGEYFFFSGEPTISGSIVTVEKAETPRVGITGVGGTVDPGNQKIRVGTGIAFLRPGQMVRYRIQYLNLDPSKPKGVPCLVRDQGTYVGTGFVATIQQAIVSENVSKFKVYLSANSTDWAGSDLADSVSGFDAGWDGATGIRSLLDTQLSSSGRPGFKSTRIDESWFRSIPVLVRVDVTTRTATQRTEYDSAANPGYDPKNPRLTYRELTQSLVFNPRHFGLTMN